MSMKEVTSKFNIKDILVKHAIEVKSHQRKTKQGKLINVDAYTKQVESKTKVPSMRTGVRKVVEKPKTPEKPKKEVSEREKYNKSVKLDLLRGVQTQITSKGVKKPTIKTLIDIYGDKLKGEGYNIVKEAKELDIKYKNTLDVMRDMVRKLGGIEQAKKNDEYQKLVKMQVDRIKEFKKIVKRYQKV